MAMEFGFILLFLIPFVIAVFLVRRIINNERRAEDEFYRRMYWTIRQANEDIKRNNDDNNSD